MELERLYQAVYDEPQSEMARRVLADALTQEGDPRGEFITLQFHTSTRARKRAEKLLSRHRQTFLGDLGRVVRSGTDVWDRGFLVACVVRLDGTLAACPAWATVRELTLEIDARAGRPIELASRWMSSLSRVTLSQPVFPSEHAHDALRRFFPVVHDVLRSVGREALLTPPPSLAGLMEEFSGGGGGESAR